MRVVDCKECDAYLYCCKVKKNTAVLLASPAAGMALCDICYGARYITIRRSPPNEDNIVRCGRCNATGWVKVSKDEPEGEEAAETSGGNILCRLPCDPRWCEIGEICESPNKRPGNPNEPADTEVKLCVHCEAKQAVIDKLGAAVREIYLFLKTRSGEMGAGSIAHLEYICKETAREAGIDIEGKESAQHGDGSHIMSDDEKIASMRAKDLEIQGE